MADKPIARTRLTQKQELQLAAAAAVHAAAQAADPAAPGRRAESLQMLRESLVYLVEFYLPRPDAPR